MIETKNISCMQKLACGVDGAYANLVERTKTHQTWSADRVFKKVGSVDVVELVFCSTR